MPAPGPPNILPIIRPCRGYKTAPRIETVQFKSAPRLAMVIRRPIRARRVRY
jgi:hypothetical protein